MKAKTKLEKGKIVYSHIMIRDAGCRGCGHAYPEKGRIEKVLEMIMNSYVTAIEEFEYSYNPIEEDLTERRKATKKDRNGKQAGVTIIYSKEGIFKQGKKKINYNKTVYTGHRKITFHIQQRVREGEAVLELSNDNENKRRKHEKS